MGRPSDAQPTVFSDEAIRGVAASVAAPAQGPTADSEPCPEAGLGDPIATRTGVVFVHGIGTQGPSETFLDWSEPIIELLTDWKTDQHDRAARAGHPLSPRIDDPVRRAEFAFNAASPPFLEVSIPEHADAPATTWVFTEAWWASDLRPP